MNAIYSVKLTWVEAAQPKNAVCIGNDETVEIEADSVESAKKEAIASSEYAHEADFATGRYAIRAEIVENERERLRRT